MNSAPPITSASLLASRMRLPARAAASVGAQARGADDRGEHRVDLRQRRRPRPAPPRPPSTSRRQRRRRASARCERCARRRVEQRRVARPEAPAQLARAWSPLRVRGERRDAKRSGWRATTSSVESPIEPVAPRSATSARHDLLSKNSGRQRRRAASPRASASMRSSTPPCPGSSVPLSFTPAWRFSSDSNRSPTTDTAASSDARTRPRARSRRASIGAAKPASRRRTERARARRAATATSAPYTPSHVLPGTDLRARACACRTRGRRNTRRCRRSTRSPSRRARATASAPAARRARATRRSARPSRRAPSAAGDCVGQRAIDPRRRDDDPEQRRDAAHGEHDAGAASRASNPARREQQRERRCAACRRRTAMPRCRRSPTRRAHSCAASSDDREQHEAPRRAAAAGTAPRAPAGISTAAVRMRVASIARRAQRHSPLATAALAPPAAARWCGRSGARARGTTRSRRRAPPRRSPARGGR